METVKRYKFRVNESAGTINVIAANCDRAESALRGMYNISLNHLLNLVSIDKMIDAGDRYKYIRI